MASYSKTDGGVLAQGCSSRLVRLKGPHNSDWKGRAAVFVNGYLTQRINSEQWVKKLRRSGHRGSIYLLEWDTGGTMGEMAAEGVGATAGGATNGVGAKFIINRGLAYAGYQLLPFTGHALMAASVVGGVYRFASEKFDRHEGAAREAGRELAQMICDGQVPNCKKELTLCGFSLGGRAVVSALEELQALSPGSTLSGDVHLIGAAVDQEQPWGKLASGLKGTIHCYYTPRDRVLRNLYTRFDTRLTNPIGACGVPGAEVSCHNVTSRLHEKLAKRIVMKTGFSYHSAHADELAYLLQVRRDR